MIIAWCEVYFFFESDFRSGRLSTKTFRFNILGGGVCFFRSENTLAHFMNLRIFLIKLAFLLMKYNTIVPIFKCKVGIFKTFLWFHRARKVSVWWYAALCPISHPVWSTCAKMLAEAILQKGPLDIILSSFKRNCRTFLTCLVLTSNQNLALLFIV